MLIDWFTVFAQIVNFLVLVWLMKRYLYKPILDAIDAREQGVSKELANADAKMSEATKEREDFEQKNKVFDAQRQDLFAKVTEEAQAEKQRLFTLAQEAADKVSAQRREALQSEAQRLNLELMRRTQEEVFSIARKTLVDLADDSLEARVCEAFSRQLSSLDDGARTSLKAALNSTSQPALLRSAFELTVGQRTSIEAILKENFALESPLRYETKPDLVGGIELSVGGQKVAWSIAHYLTSLEKDVGKLLQVPVNKTQLNGIATSENS